MLSIYLTLLFFISVALICHWVAYRIGLFTRDSFKCSTYTHFGRRALALTQNTSSRQSAFLRTNHIKIHNKTETHTHKAKTTTAIIKSFFYTHKMERDAIKINVSFPFSLKSYLHVCYSSCCCWQCCSHWNCFSDIFSNVSKRFRLNVIQCVFNAFYWHSVGINLNRLFLIISCYFVYGFMHILFWLASGFYFILYSFWHRNEAIKKMMIKRNNFGVLTRVNKKDQSTNNSDAFNVMWRVDEVWLVRHDQKYR